MAVNFLDGITIGGELTTTGGTNNITTTNGSSSLYLLNLARTTTSLTTAGNVGIGTTSPAEKLEVAGKIKITGTANFIDTTRNASSQANYIRFYDSSTSSVEAYLGFTSNNRDFKVNSANGSGTITLQAGGNTAVRISDTGNVGIGTTSPTKKLDVDGSARFRNDTQVDKAFTADTYICSANGPFGPNPGINANVVIATKFNQITLTFASGLLIGYVCDGEECPEQPPNPE